MTTIEQDIIGPSCHPAVRRAPAEIVDGLIAEAIATHATDLLIHTSPVGMRSWFRIDGMLRPGPSAGRGPSGRRLSFAVSARVKAMASLDVADRRSRQVGRIWFDRQDADCEIRVITEPSSPRRKTGPDKDVSASGSGAEEISLRLFDRSELPPDPARLGVSEGVVDALRQLCRRPHGMILFTGPPASGKTTTMYSFLQDLVPSGRSIISLEDPIERKLAGIRQTEPNATAGLTFAECTGMVLSHDPDVIVLGEISDPETASPAVSAALAGRLVLATLSVETADEAVPKLLKMGVKPFLISSALTAVFAQQLTRRVCEHCAEHYKPTDGELAWLATSDAPETLRKGRGCRYCRYTGFRGQTALSELMVPTGRLRELVLSGASKWDLAAVTATGTFPGMAHDARAKVLAGVTTTKEVLRVLPKRVAAR